MVQKISNERFESWTKWKSDDIFRMWPRQDTGVNRRPSQTKYMYYHFGGDLDHILRAKLEISGTWFKYPC